MVKAIDVKNIPASALTQLATGLSTQNDTVNLLRRAHAQYPADFWINHNLGNALGRATPPEQEEAVRFLTAAIALRPESPGCFFNLGIAQKGKGQLEEAITCYKKVIEFQPNYVAAHNGLGNSLRKIGQLDEAIACSHKAIELDPKDATYHNNLGVALKDMGQLGEAVACIRIWPVL